MSTAQKITSIDRLGIIAGGGELPAHLLHVCAQKSIAPYVVALKGQCNSQDIKDHDPEKLLWAELASAGKIISFFKDHNICDLVLIGSIKRPSFSAMKPDFKGVQILSRIALRALGDNNLLCAVKGELEHEGFKVRAIQDFCENLLMPQGVLGEYSPAPEDQSLIALGIRASQDLGFKDIGQAVIVQGKSVIAQEDEGGTDSLIGRATSLIKDNAAPALLVKTCKPQQDRALDLPTVGVKTLQNAYKAGIKGLVLHAEHTLLVDPKMIEQYANEYKMFVFGVDIPPLL